MEENKSQRHSDDNSAIVTHAWHTEAWRKASHNFFCCQGMQNQAPFRAQALSLWNASEVSWDLLDSTSRALRDTRIIELDVVQIRERMHEQRLKNKQDMENYTEDPVEYI